MWDVIFTLKWVKEHDVHNLATNYYENFFMYLNEYYDFQNVSHM